MFLFIVCIILCCSVNFVTAQNFDTDSRCPGWQGRHRLLRSSLPEEEGAAKEETKLSLASLEQEEEMHEVRQLQDTSNLPTFQLKLHWEPGFCWQAEWRDRVWCMDCEGGSCNQGDQLEIQYCSESRRQDQRLQWIPSSNNNPRVGRLKVADSNLCYHRLDGRFYELRNCDLNSNRQVLIGFDYSRPFELLAQYDSNRCLNQQHDPRQDESIELTSCSDARRTNTNRWTVIERDGNVPSEFNGAGPAPVPPPPPPPPTNSPVEPNNPRVEPIIDDPPVVVEPTDRPVQPTNPPVIMEEPPTNPPVEPTDRPVQPTNPPVITEEPPTNPPDVDNVFQDQQPPTADAPAQSTNQLQQLPTNEPRHGVRSTATTKATTMSLYLTMATGVVTVWLFWF